MNKQTLGLILQLAGIVALVVALLWSGNAVKGLIVSGAVAWLVGHYMGKPVSRIS